MALALLGAIGCSAPEADRVAEARKMKEAGLRRDVARLGLNYPPRRIYLRAFKQERELEVWLGGTTGGMKLFRTYPVAAQSGKLGPKRREGDRQVPEGFYFVNRFNPRSSYLLSLGLDYPNRRDRLRGEPKPGSDIFIHGDRKSIGCLAMTDDLIREIYVLALDSVARPIPVHLFPARLSDANWRALSQEAAPELLRFWATLRPAYLAFERTRQVPRVRLSRQGEYELIR